MTATHVALLRGINVGGKNMLPMPKLAQLFTAAGCREVQTYIQSGNVVFAAPDELARALTTAIPAAIARDLELTVPVVVRSAAELRAIAKRHAIEPDADPKLLHVWFLADKPTAAAVRALDPQRSPGDRFVVRGREIYTHIPSGGAQTKLTAAYFDRVLATTSTARNWRTVGELAKLLAQK